MILGSSVWRRVKISAEKKAKNARDWNVLFAFTPDLPKIFLTLSASISISVIYPPAVISAGVLSEAFLIRKKSRAAAAAADNIPAIRGPAVFSFATQMLERQVQSERGMGIIALINNTGRALR